MTPSYMIQPGETLDERARKRKLAEVLMMQGMDASPVQSWTQGADRLAKALLGGYQVGALGRQDAADKAGARDEMVRMLGGGSTAPSASSAPAASADPVTPTDTRVPAAIRNNNPGAMWPGPSSAKFGATGVQNVAGGNKIAAFPDPESGAAAQFDLLNRRYTNMKLADALAKWSGGNNASAYTAFAAERAGVTPDTVITPEFLASPQGVKLAQAMSRWESGRDFPLTPEQWVSAQNRALGQRVAALPPTTMTDAGSGPAPVASLPPQPAAAAPPAAPVQTAQAGGVDRATLVRWLQSGNPYLVQQAQALAQKQIERQFDEGKPTDRMREYELYRKQELAAGRQPASFFDYEVNLKKAGAIQNSVQIDQKGESEFSKEAGKLAAKRYDEIVADAGRSKQLLSDVRTLGELGKNIGTGKNAEFRATIGPYAEMLGIKIDALDDIQAFEAITNRVAPALRVPGSGAQSDMELRNFLKSLPTLGNTPDGNMLVQRTLEGMVQTKLAAAEIASRALTGEITRKDADKLLRDLPDPMAEWREMNKKVGAKTTTTPPATDGGWKTLPNGVRIREKQ